MSKKKGNFAGQFLDKIILGLTGVVALYLLWAFILSNPYGPRVGNRTYSPSEIDPFNKRQAQQIQKKLQEPAQPNPYVQDKAAEFSNLLNSPMPKLSIVANWPLPGGGQTDTGGDRKYVVPQIPVLENIKFASIRGTVRMPTEDVTPEVPYASVAAKPADIYLITVSAHLNLQALYNNFQQSFTGPRLDPRWKDPTYAEPVLARIELQRRVQNADGSWEPWQTVPFTRIDPYQKMFKELPLTTEQMTYGNVALFMNSYREFAVMKDILQPAPYEFLSSQVKWFPAEYYLEYRKISDEQEQQKLREERERRQKEKTERTSQNRFGGTGMETRRTQPPSQPPRRGGRGENPMMEGMGGGMAAPVKPVKPIKTLESVEKDAAAATIDEKTKLSAMKELVVWIHDDTVVTGATYQYRIRYGAFNPIAGKEWFAPESKENKNQVVLWSDYTELLDPVSGRPESVSIPKMLHLFPMDVLADGTGVTIEIYKYYLGQWHTETFGVHPGQMIGKPMESKPKTSPGGAGGMGNPMGMDAGGVQQSLLVDYSTGCMLMDVQRDTDWSGPSVRPRDVPSMLYLDDNNRILVLAAKKSYWPREMNTEYNTVREEMLKAAGVSGEGMMPGMEGTPPEMMMKIQDVGAL